VPFKLQNKETNQFVAVSFWNAVVTRSSTRCLSRLDDEHSLTYAEFFPKLRSENTVRARRRFHARAPNPRRFEKAESSEQSL